MKYFQFIGIIFCIFTFSCSVDSNDSGIGTIMITSDFDCEFWLQDMVENQVAHDYYDPAFSKFTVVPMRETGIFVVIFESGTKIKKDTLIYSGGNMEYFIES